MTDYSAGHSFVRDRFTWLMYAMLGLYAYFESGLGPMLPFLRAELGINHTVAGLRISAFAAGLRLQGRDAALPERSRQVTEQTEFELITWLVIEQPLAS